MDNCTDVFPTNPSKNLRGLVRHYNSILARTPNHDRMAAAPYREAIIICGSIKSHIKKQQFLELQDKTWPYPIDFKALTRRVLLMKSQLTKIIENEETRLTSIPYRRLIENVGGKANLTKLASMVIPPAAVMDDSRPG